MDDADLRLFDGDVFQCFGKVFCCGLLEAAMWGTETGSGRARLAPASLAAAMARSTAAVLPAITTWPGELKLTASTTSPCGFGANGRLVRLQTQNSGHCAYALRYGGLHEFGAQADESLTASAKSNAPAARGGVFAEAVAATTEGFAAGF